MVHKDLSFSEASTIFCKCHVMYKKAILSMYMDLLNQITSV